MSTTYIISMPPNAADGRRKTTKVAADDLVEEWVHGHWTLTFIKGARGDEEEIAKFVDPESWMVEGAAERAAER